MHVEFKDLSASFCWTNKLTIQMSLNFILHPTTNLHSCLIRTLVDVLAQILESSQSSRNLNIEMTIKEKKKLRTVGDHILIGKSGPIAFKNQAIVRPSIQRITVLSPIYSLSLYSLGKCLLHFPLTIHLAWGLSTPHGPCSIYFVTFAKRSGCS